MCNTCKKEITKVTIKIITKVISITTKETTHQGKEVSIVKEVEVIPTTTKEARQFLLFKPEQFCCLSPEYHSGAKAPNNEGKATTEELIEKLIASNKAQDETRRKIDEANDRRFKALEHSVGQIASSLSANKKGKFPSTTIVNPKEQCKAITLRSGINYEGSSMPMKNEKVEEKEVEENLVEEEFVEESEVEVKANDETDVVESEVVEKKWQRTKALKKKEEEVEVERDSWGIPKTQVPIPFPHRFLKKGLDEKFAKFLEIFKKIHINKPFADALIQMPHYAKFLKYIMARKGA